MQAVNGEDPPNIVHVVTSPSCNNMHSVQAVTPTFYPSATLPPQRKQNIPGSPTCLWAMSLLIWSARSTALAISE